MPFISFVSTAG